MAISFQYNKTSLHALGKQLKMREGALPILKNKESALRVKVIKQKKELKQVTAQVEENQEKEEKWLSLVGRFPIKTVSVQKVHIEKKKIAGVSIPLLKGVDLHMEKILWHEAPHWYPDVLDVLQRKAELEIALFVAQEQLKILEQERKKTTQKVNLYEKVQIPELEEAIKKIKRFLEDQQNLSKAAQKMVKARKMEA